MDEARLSARVGLALGSRPRNPFLRNSPSSIPAELEDMSAKPIVCLFLGFAACAGLAVAQEDFDPQPVIEGRQSALRDIGGAFKGINDELKKPQPSLPTIRMYAKQIEELSRQQKLWFPPGTGPESDIETAAKPEIWQQPAKFKAGQVAMGEQAAKLAKVAAGDDVKAIKAQWQALGQTCKGCHDTFREEDD
jgi:cytochrome c556